MLCFCQSNVSSSQWHQPHQLQRPQIHSQSLPPCRLHQKTALFVLCFQSNRKYQNHLKSWLVQISYTKEITIYGLCVLKRLSSSFVNGVHRLYPWFSIFPLWLIIISFIFFYLSFRVAFNLKKMLYVAKVTPWVSSFNVIFFFLTSFNETYVRCSSHGL